MHYDRRARRKTPEECLRIAVDALGGLQEVGHALKGADSDPVAAGQWLAHCLTASKRDKLSEQQREWIFRKAAAIGAHEGFQAYAASLGYTATAQAADALLVEAVKRAEAARQAAEDTAHDLADLLDNPRLLATLRAAGVKVDTL